jgi:hypothetical protein
MRIHRNAYGWIVFDSVLQALQPFKYLIGVRLLLGEMILGGHLLLVRFEYGWEEPAMISLVIVVVVILIGLLEKIVLNLREIGTQRPWSYAWIDSSSCKRLISSVKLLLIIEIRLEALCRSPQD